VVYLEFQMQNGCFAIDLDPEQPISKDLERIQFDVDVFHHGHGGYHLNHQRDHPFRKMFRILAHEFF
jgi:hypothetical protein